MRTSATAPMPPATMTATAAPATPPPATPPSTPSGAAQAGQNAADALRNPRETIEGWGKGVAEFFNNLKAGNVIGGALGMVGAWLIGSMFGAGPFQTILMVLLLPLGLYLGAKAAGDWSKDVAPPASNRGGGTQNRTPQQGREQGQRRADLGEPETGVAMANLNTVENDSIAFSNTTVTLGAPVEGDALLRPGATPPPDRLMALNGAGHSFG